MNNSSQWIDVANVKIASTDFPDLARLHRSKYCGTAETEEEGAALVRSGFAHAETRNFVRAVCRWGGHAGIAGRVLKDNTLTKIAGAFSEAHGLASRGCIEEGLISIMQLKQLGTTSFASKHLRFIQPEMAVVLDSVIRDKLGYAMNAAGYRLLLDTCAHAVTALNELGIHNPLRVGGVWYVSDVEAALFAKLRWQ